MVGGFLGAGKTTTITRLARMYQDRGLRVGIVTNDQAADLVDTTSLRAQGFDVGEVAGACFCCNFNELTATIGRLAAAQMPDVVLAEPVGSCTDLVATVVQPLVQLFRARFDVAPYGVLLKPGHGRKILRGERGGGFSPKAEYIFRKQLEEADFILLNRIDVLSALERGELEGLLAEQFPGLPVVQVSARTGVGFNQLFELLTQAGAVGRRVLELDYDVYAAGEAELGWLNGSLAVHAPRPFLLDDLLLDLVAGLRASLAAAEVPSAAGIAHFKAIGLCDSSFCVANLTGNEAAPELSLPSNASVNEAQLVVNARVAMDPVVLEQHVRAAVADACGRHGATATFGQVQRFRPGRPVPTHRLVPVT
jgi:Ni2+-binding GTPase involved in maturation of urease and hydrogenase